MSAERAIALLEAGADTSIRSPSECEAQMRLMKAAPAMLAALIVAREFISTDRNSLAESVVYPDGTMNPEDAAMVADYDGALLQIDGAIAAATGSPS